MSYLLHPRIIIKQSYVNAKIDKDDNDEMKQEKNSLTINFSFMFHFFGLTKESIYYF